MADEIIKGSQDFTLTDQQKKWSKERGWYVQKIYEGPRATHESFCDTLINIGADDLGVSTGKAVCIISASFPLEWATRNEDQQAKDDALWELTGESVEKRLETHGKFQVSGSSQAVIEKINKALEDGTACDSNWNTLYPSLGEFNAYRDLRLMGVDSYQSYTWRVRCTWTISRKSLLKAVYTDVNKVIAWSAIGVPSSAHFDQPTILMVVPMAGSVVGFTNESVNEWLVQPPSVRWRKGIRKWEITKEWLGAVKISGTLYSGGGMTP